MQNNPNVMRPNHNIVRGMLKLEKNITKNGIAPTPPGDKCPVMLERLSVLIRFFVRLFTSEMAGLLVALLSTTPPYFATIIY